MGNSAPDWLLGLWVSDPTDEDTMQEFGSSSLEFNPDGSLIFCKHESGDVREFRMNYRVEQDHIVTNQGASEERTNFGLSADGRLRLTHAGRNSFYVKGA